MTHHSRTLSLTASLLLAGTACSSAEPGTAASATRNEPAAVVATEGAGAAVDVAPLPSPAAPGSTTPSLFAADDGTVYMSWLEPTDEAGDTTASTRRGSFALRFAALRGDAWSAARTIAVGDDFFVNWADFPMIIAGDGVLAAHWLRRNGGRGTAYDISIARSEDAGTTWSAPRVPHTDGTATEHGFVSLVPEPGGGFAAIWLDGREHAVAEGAGDAAMTLRATRFDASGEPEPEQLLDERICDCCQTSATFVGDTLVAVYRDRSTDEIRDIASVRRTAEGWQPPVTVAADGWRVPGCPVNGPAIAAQGDTAAVAWFTMGGADPLVKVTFTRDAGATFGTPVIVDRGTAASIDASNPRQVAGLAEASDAQHPVPLGRVDVVWLDDTTALVSWMVARGAAAELALQPVRVDGTLGDRRRVADTGSMRASGFPRMVRQGDRVVLAWTLPEGDAGVRTAAIRLADLR